MAGPRDCLVRANDRSTTLRPLVFQREPSLLTLVVDVLSLGGTNNGLLFGEAVVVLNPNASQGLRYLRKMNMQLASRMRIVSGEFIALLELHLWLRPAPHASDRAHRLFDAISGIDESLVDRRPDANAVFAVLPAGVADRIQKRFASATGMSRPGQSAGRAPGTPLNPMSTPSRWPSSKKSPSAEQSRRYLRSEWPRR